MSLVIARRRSRLIDDTREILVETPFVRLEVDCCRDQMPMEMPMFKVIEVNPQNPSISYTCPKCGAITTLALVSQSDKKV